MNQNASVNLFFWKASKLQRQTQAINQFSGDGCAPQSADLAAFFEKFIFGQRVNEIAANSGFPIQPVGFIQARFMAF